MSTTTVNRITGAEVPDTTETDLAAVASAERVHPAPTNRRFAIAGDTVVKATTDLPENQRVALRWFAEYGRKKNLRVEECAELLQKPNGETYSYHSLYAAWTGRREGGLENLTEAIEKFRRRSEEADPRKSSSIIVTALSQKISTYCRRAFERKRVSFIFGESQIGKTYALAEYARVFNHGETKMFRMPTRGSLSDLMNEMASSNNVSPHSRHSDRRRRIIESFDENMLLIVDECHQCLGNTSDRALASLEFIREIHDRRKCGVVLCGTNVFRDALKTNKVLRQLWLRGMPPLQLPSVSTPNDLLQFASAYGLGAPLDGELEITTTDSDGKKIKHSDNPAKLQHDVNEKFGLGRWCAILQEASELAKERKKPMSWGYVLLAHAQFEAMGHFDLE